MELLIKELLLRSFQYAASNTQLPIRSFRYAAAYTKLLEWSYWLGPTEEELMMPLIQSYWYRATNAEPLTQTYWLEATDMG